MHHIRKSNHRKMLKPKFYSSSSDDDIDDDAAPLKWKPIIAKFPLESNSAPKQNPSIQSNPIIDCLNSQMSKQQKLSAEVIQKEEIYNQAELEANKKMFGCANPGRCLSKDENRRRKDIILHIVNERLKSKLSELMGEFGERLEMNDAYAMGKSNDDDSNRYRNRTPDDDDSLPEAPPPPTFNTSSDSSDNELDISMTKEFELYEKEIKEKTSDVKSSNQSLPPKAVTDSFMLEAPAAPSIFTLSASYNSIQIRPTNQIHTTQSTTSVPSTISATPMSENLNILQQTSSNYQNNWQQSQQPQMQQWSMTAQSVDMAPWNPPVGPPQLMEPFPTPIEAERIALMAQAQLIPSFIQTNPPPPTGWIQPSFPSNYGSVPQYPNPEWINTSQPPPNLGRAPIPAPRHSLIGQSSQRMNWNAMGNRPAGLYGRPTAPHNESAVIRPDTSLISARNQVFKPFTTPNTTNVPIVSKSTFVNAILDSEQKLAKSSTETVEKKVNFNPVNNNFNDQNRNNNGKMERFGEDSKKRPFEQQVDKVSYDVFGNSIEQKDSHENANDVTKRLRFNDNKIRKSRFDKPQNIPKPVENRTDQVQPINNNQRSASLEHRLNSRNVHRTSLEPKEHNGIPTNRRKSPQLEARHEQTNAETFKYLSKFWKTKNDKTADVKNSRIDQIKEPAEWTKLCNIVDKLLDLTPNILKDLPVTDRRIKERNEILMILSEDPEKFYAHVGKYGEHNVNWAVKMAQRILFPQGRLDDRVASKIAPFQNAIDSDTPKEWQKLCKIVDNLLDIPTRIAESLPSSDSRIKERNDILMILSNDPEDFLLHDEKYGAHNVNWTILAAKRILSPDGVYDERVGRIMMRQRDKLMGVYSKSSKDRSFSNDRQFSNDRHISNDRPVSSDRSFSNEKESRKRSYCSNTNDHRARSVPKEWNQLCEIADKVLDIPFEVRIKLNKKDPRWEQRDSILLVLSDDPDKLVSQSKEYGHVNVDWAIKAAKKLIFPKGSRDKTIVKKLSPQRNLLLRSRQSNSIKDDKTMVANKTMENQNNKSSIKVQKEKQTTQKIGDNNKVQMNVDGDTTKKEKSPTEKKGIKKDQESEKNQLSKENKFTKDNKSTKANQPIKNSQENKADQSTSRKIDSEEKSTKANQPINSQEKKSDQSTSTKNDSEKTSSVTPIIAVDVEIDAPQVWTKLCNIVDKLLDLPPNAADKLPPSDKRLTERNEILMVLSDDPDNFSKFEANYGDTNVVWAIKSAKKLIYFDGKPNEKLTDFLWKMRDNIMCSEENSKQETKDPSSNESYEFIYIRKIATKAFQLSIKNNPNKKALSKELMYQQIELLLQLSDDPDIVRTKSICKTIGEGRVEVAIAQCKHLLSRVHKLGQKVLINFEFNRTRMVLYLESQSESRNIKNYDVILEKVRQIVDQKLFNEIFGGNFNKWTQEQKLERNELAILMIKDPSLLKSNAKYLEMVLKTEKGESADIISEVEKCLLNCEYIKEKPAELEKSKKPAVCAPIIAKVKDVKYMSTFKERKLTKRIHRLIEQFLIAPKPEVFDVRYDESDGTVDVVCANLMTFNWLKSSINELDGLWPNAKLNISKAPITRKVLDVDDLKQIKMTFKTVPTESFAVIMKQLKKSNSKLNTDRWQSIPSNFTDSKKMLVMVDLESLIELERSKREINIGSATIYFDIKYIGTENFDAKC